MKMIVQSQFDRTQFQSYRLLKIVHGNDKGAHHYTLR